MKILKTCTNVCTKHEMNNMCEDHELHVISNALLLGKIFENNRKTISEKCEINPVSFALLPGLS